MENTQIATFQQAYKHAVDAWLTAIKAEEALALAGGVPKLEPLVDRINRVKVAHFNEEIARCKAKGAKQTCADAIRLDPIGWSCRRDRPSRAKRPASWHDDSSNSCGALAVEHTDVATMRESYRAAVDEWLTAIRAEEALALADPAQAEVDLWEEAHVIEEIARGKARAANKNCENALRVRWFSF